MSKYVFKNAEVEKALRLIAKELGVSDEEFDEKVQLWGDSNAVYIDRPDNGHIGLYFSTSILEEVKEFNPNGWNDPNVIPPVSPYNDRVSTLMLVEDDFGYPEKGFYDFSTRRWIRRTSCELIRCSRYRLYPSD